MKKVDLLVSLTYVAQALFVSYLIVLLPWSVISKVICLIWCWCVSLSVASLAIRESLGSWSTTKRPDGSNHLATLAAKERVIATRIKMVQMAETGTLTSDRILDDFYCPCGNRDCDGFKYH